MELDWSFLGNAVHKVVRKLEKKNLTHVEAFYTYTKTTEVTIRNSEVLTQNRMDDSGVGFRIAVSGSKVGFACTNVMEEEAILEAGENALAIAKVSPEIPNFTLPQGRSPPKVKGLFDPAVAAIDIGEAVDAANRAIIAAEGFDKRVIAKDGRFLYESGWRGIINTQGVDFEERGTRVVAYLGGSGKQNGEVTGSCYYLILGRTADLEPERLGETVGKKVINMLNPRRLESFQGSVIFSSEAVSYQLFEVLTEALKGDAVFAGSSVWAGKLSQSVASKILTVVDDALIGGGFASRSFDGEGCASHKTPLITKGKLAGYLHDATSANVLETRNSGNASRFPGGFDMIRSIIGEGYRTRPEIYPSNLTIQPGNSTKDELITEIRKGILVESMAGFPQAGSGVISTQLSQAFFIKNGEIINPVKNGMVSGVAFDWFKKISQVSNDSKQFPNAIVPSLLVEDVKIIGT